MRTEEDLRTALTSLEQHAPAAARVMPGPSRRARDGLRSRPSVRWLAGIATAAALAGVAVGVTLTSGTSSTIPNGGVTSPSAATAKLLAAISAAASDIAYTRATEVSTSPGAINAPGGELNSSGENWLFPWQPSTGQQVRSYQVRTGSGGTPVFGMGLTYDSPAPEAIGTKGSTIFVNYKTKSWSEQSGVCVVCQLTGSYPTNLTELIKDNDFKEVGRVTVDGHRAIEFHAVELGDSSTLWLRINSTLWVDAATYLPLRLTSTESLRHEYTDTTTTDYQLLPATPGNLAKLTPPVPAGFHKVADAQ
ncbi:MAG: hypothetical protein ACRDP7_49675 [Trebonia sp.]